MFDKKTPSSDKGTKAKKAMSWKTRLLLLQLVALVLLGLSFLLYYSTTKKALETARSQTAQIQQLDQELERCNQVISQGQGQFAQYEYCTQLLNTFQNP